MNVEPVHGGLDGGVKPSFRARVHRELSPEGRITPAARFLIAAIVLATLIAVAETEPVIREGREIWFHGIELVFAIIFSVEYGLRLWSAPETGMSRLRWATRPMSIIDLLAILGSISPMLGPDTVLLRLFRVLRILRLAKLGRFSRAFAIMERAVRARASHFGVTFMLFLFFLVAAAALIYLVEGAHQPDKFGSIPRSLWWTAVTMTTVGYGDVVPVTPFGKILAAFISIGGIILVAIPTGIIAASFSDEFAAEERLRVDRHHGKGSHP